MERRDSQRSNTSSGLRPVGHFVRQQRKPHHELAQVSWSVRDRHHSWHDKIRIRKDTGRTYQRRGCRTSKGRWLRIYSEPFYREENFGLLDTVAGFVYADKACRFALHKAEVLGVRTILGGPKGTFSTFLRDASPRLVGVQTADGRSHSAELTIRACGGWTPSLVPQLDHLCETTAGSACIFELQKGSPLWDRFAPENFPTWT